MLMAASDASMPSSSRSFFISVKFFIFYCDVNVRLKMASQG
jgi:hypothetical protein